MDLKYQRKKYNGSLDKTEGSGGQKMGFKHFTSPGNHELRGFSNSAKSSFQFTSAKTVRLHVWEIWKTSLHIFKVMQIGDSRFAK